MTFLLLKPNPKIENIKKHPVHLLDIVEVPLMSLFEKGHNVTKMNEYDMHMIMKAEIGTGKGYTNNVTLW